MIIAAISTLSLVLMQGSAATDTQDKPKKDAQNTSAKKVKKANKFVTVDGYPISIKTIKPQPIVSIRIQCKDTDLTKNYGKYLPMLFGYAGQNGGKFAGQPLAIFHPTKKKGMVDVEMACPLVKPIKGKGNIKAAMLAGGKVAVTFHLGAYHKLTKSYDAMNKWFKQNKLETGGPQWEVYTSDPTKVKPSEVRTDVFFPIKVATKKKGGKADAKKDKKKSKQ